MLLHEVLNVGFPSSYLGIYVSLSRKCIPSTFCVQAIIQIRLRKQTSTFASYLIFIVACMLLISMLQEVYQFKFRERNYQKVDAQL